MSDERAPLDGELIEREIEQAISTVLATHEGSFMLNWVAIIETADPDGSRGMWCFTNEQAKAWNTTGLLTHALHLQQAQLMRDEDDEYLVHILGAGGTHLLASLAEANCLVLIDEHTTSLPTGAEVTVSFLAQRP